MLFFFEFCHQCIILFFINFSFILFIQFFKRGLLFFTSTLYFSFPICLFNFSPFIYYFSLFLARFPIRSQYLPIQAIHSNFPQPSNYRVHMYCHVSAFCVIGVSHRSPFRRFELATTRSLRGPDWASCRFQLGIPGGGEQPLASLGGLIGLIRLKKPSALWGKMGVRADGEYEGVVMPWSLRRWINSPFVRVAKYIITKWATIIHFP